jgi:hypothetical protein
LLDTALKTLCWYMRTVKQESAEGRDGQTSNATENEGTPTARHATSATMPELVSYLMDEALSHLSHAREHDFEHVAWGGPSRHPSLLFDRDVLQQPFVEWATWFISLLLDDSQHAFPYSALTAVCGPATAAQSLGRGADNDARRNDNDARRHKSVHILPQPRYSASRSVGKEEQTAAKSAGFKSVGKPPLASGLYAQGRRQHQQPQPDNASPATGVCAGGGETVAIPPAKLNILIQASLSPNMSLKHHIFDIVARVLYSSRLLVLQEQQANEQQQIQQQQQQQAEEEQRTREDEARRGAFLSSTAPPNLPLDARNSKREGAMSADGTPHSSLEGGSHTNPLWITAPADVAHRGSGQANGGGGDTSTGSARALALEYLAVLREPRLTQLFTARHRKESGVRVLHSGYLQSLFNVLVASRRLRDLLDLGPKKPAGVHDWLQGQLQDNEGGYGRRGKKLRASREMELTDEAKPGALPSPIEAKTKPKDSDEAGAKLEAEQKRSAEAEFKWERTGAASDGTTEPRSASGYSAGYTPAADGWAVCPQLELVTEEVSSSSISFSWSLADLVEHAAQPNVAEPKVASAQQQWWHCGDKQAKPEGESVDAKGLPRIDTSMVDAHSPIAPPGANLTLVLERWEDDPAGMASTGKFTALAVASALNSSVSG